MEPHKRAFNRLHHQPQAEKETLPDVAQLIAESSLSTIEHAFRKNPEHFLQARDSANNSIIHMALKAGLPALIPLFAEQDTDILSHRNYQAHSPLQFAITNDATSATVKLLLKHGADPMELCGRQSTLLHLAAENGRTDLIPLLINAGVDINQLNHAKETPLFLALQTKHDNVASALLRSGANPLTCNTHNISPLHAALKNACQLAVEIMLDDIDVIKNLNNFKTSNDGTTPLMMAVANSTLPVVNKMIELGANINKKNIFQRSVICYALDNPDLQTCNQVTALLLHKGIDINEMEQETFLNDMIASQGDFEVIENLINCGMDINKCNNLQQSPLYLAIKHERLDVVRLLLQEGVDPNDSKQQTQNAVDSLYRITDTDKSLTIFKLLKEHGFDIHKFNEKDRTPLQEAALAGHAKIVKYLLQQNVDVDIKSTDDKKMPAFLFATENNNNVEQRMEILEMLIKAGADIHATDINGRTAMHYAAENTTLTRLQYLHETGLNIQAKDHEGETPLESAVCHQRSQNVFYIAEQISTDINHIYEDGCSLLHHIAKHGKQTLLQELLDNPMAYDLDIDICDSEGRTPLILATHENQTPIMEILIEYDAEIDVLDNDGYSALYYATAKFLQEPVEILLKHKASIDNFPKSDKSSFLHMAAEAERPTLVECFVKAGAKIDERDLVGNTPLHTAVRFKNEDVAKSLLTSGANENIRNKAGFSPLDIAQHKNAHPLIHLLKKYAEYRKSGGANPIDYGYQRDNPYYNNRGWR